MDSFCGFCRGCFHALFESDRQDVLFRIMRPVHSTRDSISFLAVC